MFTGIIQEIGTVVNIERTAGLMRVSIHARTVRRKLQKGSSIAIDGICSTVVKVGLSWFIVEYMPETIQKTTAGKWLAGLTVNLELPLRVGDPLDGHLVTGHVDCVGKIIEVSEKGKDVRLTIQIAPPYARFIAEKGSVAMNGVSLTIVEVKKSTLSVALIPYTLVHTNLQHCKKNDRVNIEVDLLARYIERLRKA